MSRWSTERVLALAPDGASVAAGRKLAVARGWPALGCDARATLPGSSSAYVCSNLSDCAYAARRTLVAARRRRHTRPLAARGGHRRLIALADGAPLQVSAEGDGATMHPFAAVTDDARTVALT